MAIEVHERRLLLPPPSSAVPPLFQRFTQYKNSTSFQFSQPFICHKRGIFLFSTTKHKPCHQCFFWDFSQLGDFISENQKARIIILRILDTFRFFEKCK
jgi:hypothetical protein